MSSFFIFGARLMHSATACDDSSAGIMPSIRARPAAGVERLLIAGRHVLGASLIVQQRVLGTDRRIVESGRNRMRQRDLAVVVLQDVRVRALQHARAAAVEARGMLAERVCRVRRPPRRSASRLCP